LKKYDVFATILLNFKSDNQIVTLTLPEHEKMLTIHLGCFTYFLMQEGEI